MKLPLKGICGFSPLFLNATGPRPSPTEFCLVCRQREEQVRDADAWVHRTQTFRAMTVRRTRVRTCCFRQERYDSPPIERSSRYADGKCPHGDCPRCPLLPGVTTWGLSPLPGVEIAHSGTVPAARKGKMDGKKFQIYLKFRHLEPIEASAVKRPHNHVDATPSLRQKRMTTWGLSPLPTWGLSPLPILAELDTQLIIAEMQGYAPYAHEMKSRIIGLMATIRKFAAALRK